MPVIDPALPSPEAERDALIGAALEAGEAIMPFFRAAPVKTWAKDDRTPVTEADLRADAVLREALVTGSRADYGWLSEESADDPERLEKKRTLIIDPIDGTRAFLRGDDQFTVCLAVCEAGEVLASVIYAPARGEMYAAAKDGGATLNGAPIRSSQRDALEDAAMIAYAKMFAHPGWPQPWPPMRTNYKNSTSYRLALVAAGQADATLALAPKADWDTAPGALIAAEAGARVSDHLARPFRFAGENPIQPGLVCAAAPLYPDVIARLSHLPSDLRTLQR